MDELAVISEVYEAEQILDEIKKRIDKTKEEIEDIENDDSSFSKPLLSSLKSEKTDLEIYEKKYNSQVEIWGKKRRQEELLIIIASFFLKINISAIFDFTTKERGAGFSRNINTFPKCSFFL